MGFIHKSLNAARKFTVCDYGWFKLALVSLGIILGAYLAEFFLSIIVIVWIVFILSFLWILYRAFFKHWKE